MFAGHDVPDHETGIPGIRVRTLCFGDRTLMAEFLLAAGSLLPLHAHPHEQTGYLVTGRLILTAGEERREMAPGDSWCIPGDLAHQAQVVEDSVAVEVFSPVREDYLP